MSGNITLRSNKGSALTYDELDDNFRAASGEANVRWLKLKNSELNENLKVPGEDNTIVKWKTISNADSNHFTTSSQNSIIKIEKQGGGVHRISANVVLDFQADSSLNNSLSLQLLKNNTTVISEVFYVPFMDVETLYSLQLSTVENLLQNDELSLKLVANNTDTTVSYFIAEDKGEFVIEWLGYNP